MAVNRSDSAVEEDLWTEDDRDIIDDVFEITKTHDQDHEPRRHAARVQTRDVAAKEDGCQRSTSMKPSSEYSLWSVYSRQYAGLQGNPDSIIHRLHPTFCLETPPAPPPPKGTTPTTPTTEPLAEMVTLHSLGCSRDSGYVPSPCSTHSFTYSSDEEEPKDATTPRPGVTPPIAIPHSRSHRPTHHQETSTPSETKKEEEEEESRTPTYRCRTRSCPDQVRLPVLPRTPVPRFPPRLTPAHARNWSSPTTTRDGQPLLTPSPLEVRVNNTPRASRDALIDLSEEDGGASGGHRRRVLVLALPDVVIDTEGRATGACTPPSAETPKGHPGCRGPRGRRPAWQKPRALSCDVTLVEEVGQELRRIADGFQRMAEREEDASFWRLLRGGFRRSFNSFLAFSQGEES